MTEYRETKQDREDAAKLARIDTVLAQLDAAHAALGETMGEVYATREGIEQDRESLRNRRDRIVREGEERIAAFHTDRSKVKRAARELRSLGFVVSFREPSYESASPGTFDIVAAQQDGTPHAQVARRQYEHSFERADTRSYRSLRGEQGDTLTNEMYLSWGPIGEESKGDSFAIGSTIAFAFANEGLTVEWGGSDADCVTIQPQAAE